MYTLLHHCEYFGKALHWRLISDFCLSNSPPHHNVRLYEVNWVAYVHSLLHNMAVKWHYIIVTARACDFFGQRWFWESGTSFGPTQKFQTIIIALRSLFLMLNRRIAASWELSCHTRLRRPHRLLSVLFHLTNERTENSIPFVFVDICSKIGYRSLSLVLSLGLWISEFCEL